MADVHSKAVRSYNMSRIKAVNTKPELLVRKYLHAKGFRYKLHDSNLPGKPDLVLPKYHTVIFVHGCFWHGHNNCKYFTIPKTRSEWWEEKINKNIANDNKTIQLLKQMGWKIIVIWGCDLKSGNKETVLNKLVLQITN